MFRLSDPRRFGVEGQTRCPKCRECEIKYIFLALVTAPRSRFQGFPAFGRDGALDNGRFYAQWFPWNVHD